MKGPIELSPMLDRGGQPSVRELLSNLAFNPVKGTISLGDARIVMQRADVGHQLRQHLIARLGEDEAQVFLLRQGFLSGLSDARFVRRTWPNLNQGDAFTAGTRLHMFSGVVRVETVHNAFDFKRRRFSGDFIWHDSVEAELITRQGLRTKGPACWTQVGYAAGYASEFFDMPILYKEVSCTAQGAKQCRVVGKPLEEWDQDDPFVQMFRKRIIADEAPSPVRQVRTDQFGAPTSPQNALLASDIALLNRLMDLRLPVLVCGGCATSRRDAVDHVMGGAHTPLAPPDPANLAAMLGAGRARSDAKKTSDRIWVGDVTELDSTASTLAALAIARGLPLVGTSRHCVDELAGTDRLDPDLRIAFAPGLVDLRPLSQCSRSELTEILQRIALRAAARTNSPAPENAAMAWLVDRAGESDQTALEAVVTRAMVHSQTAPVSIEALSTAWTIVHRRSDPPKDQSRIAELAQAALHASGPTFEEVEAEIYRSAVARNHGNLSAAARQLGLSRATLAYRLSKIETAGRIAE